MSNIDIKALVEQAGINEWWNSGSEWRETFDECLERFAALYREALFAELLAGSGEPVAYLYHDADSAHSADPLLHSVLLVTAKSRMSHYRNETPLRTSNQLAAAVLRERERCVSIALPKTKRPCDCTQCDCGNSGDAASVAFWDAENAICVAIRKGEQA